MSRLRAVLVRMVVLGGAIAMTWTATVVPTASAEPLVATNHVTLNPADSGDFADISTPPVDDPAPPVVTPSPRAQAGSPDARPAGIVTAVVVVAVLGAFVLSGISMARMK